MLFARHVKTTTNYGHSLKSKCLREYRSLEGWRWH